MEKSTTPGLKKVKNKQGEITRLIWCCTPEARKAGFKQVHVNLTRFKDDQQALELRCQSLFAQQAMFLSGTKPADTTDLTIAGIIKRYQAHPESPYRTIQETTRRPYDFYAEKICATVGTRRIDRLTALDVMRWHKDWRAPDEAGQPEKLAAAWMALSVFKAALSFAVASGVRPAAELLTMIREGDFPRPAPRTEAPEAAQVEAARKAAHANGRPGSALAYAIQFEGAMRQYDVIGFWVPLSDPRPSDILAGKLKWIGPRWSNVVNGILEWTPQKTRRSHGKPVRLRLADFPMIAEELAHWPPEKRTGPIVVNRQGRPFMPDMFRQAWTQDRETAGLPSTLWNRDFRAGGLTEGSNAGVSTDDLAKVAANSPRVNRQVYQRNLIEAGQRFAEARKRARE